MGNEKTDIDDMNFLVYGKSILNIKMNFRIMK